MAGFIEIVGARSHNLKNISCKIPRGKITVVTGVSGSGKSTLAFDTLFAEGQRRYVESLSTYARQFLERMNRPDVDKIVGIPPAIAIEQKNTIKNARSTVGTASEIYDHVRLLFAKVGDTMCPDCGTKVAGDTVQGTVQWVMENLTEKRIYVVAPVELGGRKDAAFRVQDLIKNGFYRMLADGDLVDMTELPRTYFEDCEQIDLLIDRIAIEPGSENRLAEAVQTCFAHGGKTCEIETTEGDRHRFVQKFLCNKCMREFVEPHPLLFSFNSPLGACPTCQGFGRVIGIDLDKVIPNKKRTLKEEPIVAWNTPAYYEAYDYLWKACRRYSVPTDRPFESLTERQREIIISGRGDWFGIKGFFDWLESRRYRVHVRVYLSRYRSYTDCETCEGTRLKEEARQVYIDGKNIADLARLSIEELLVFFQNLHLGRLKETIGRRILREIRNRLGFMTEVGLGYLTLNRQTRTLSSGEFQRITLARSLGSALTETLYVLDEPSIGLHPRDSWRLLGALKRMRDGGNTIVVVEHDPEIITEADEIIDLGPGAGHVGGSVVFQGKLSELLKCKHSITAKYLDNQKALCLQAQNREPKGWITVRNAWENNLKHIDVSIPLGLLVCITGVSGAGKTTLVQNVLYAGIRETPDPRYDRGKFDSIEGLEQIKEIIMVDQSPIGRSIRSNSATYLKIFDEVRQIFAGTRVAKRNGLKPSYFSFNVSGGRCEACQGAGVQIMEMQFLEDVIVTCDKCGGRRFEPDVLEILFEGKSILDVLNMTVEEALDFFTDHRRITRKLRVLREVGLAYLSLGQSTSTLSGGEAQRLKLAHHIADSGGSGRMFIFDEPTTGLHLADIEALLKSVNKLLDQGNSVVVIEHNLDLISCADHIIDLGPEGGDRGGAVVAQGPLSGIMENQSSHTGKFLRKKFLGEEIVGERKAFSDS
ncbi:MAG: excinuclease ABC subunit UvrA [Proteobacteria bacterium]|nr:excinuclease ABC subunit UvrA [Pseudomonadota bacterium]